MATTALGAKEAIRHPEGGKAHVGDGIRRNAIPMERLMTPGSCREFLFFSMSLEPTSLETVDELYAFVESAVHRTGLALDADALYRPWARAVSAECKDVKWFYPSRPLSEQVLRHLTNFAHRPLPAKGLLLFELGKLVAVVDVDGVGGSTRPDHLGSIVQQAFATRFRSGPKSSTEVQTQSTNPYQILGANEIDTEEEIKRKYKQMVLQYHPDRVAHLGSELQDLASRKTKEINAAFAAIKRLRGF